MYDKKNLRCGELEGHLSRVKSRPTTCADLEAVCKKPGDGIELCHKWVTQTLGLHRKVHKMSWYSAFDYLLLPFAMQNL